MAEEDKKPQGAEQPPGPDDKPPAGAWKHDQDISFKRVVPHMHTIKEALQKAISHEKARLQQMVGARDSIRK